MPRTAATQSSERSQKRPSARLRATSVTGSTPILLRLPAVETAVSYPDETFDDVETQAGQPATPLPPTVTVAETASEAVEPVAAAEPLVGIAAAVETENERSWWEHWSSGVVLILLIVALITASIIALSDSGGTDPDLLADFVESETSSLGDLSSIEIPDVQMPQDQTASPPTAVEQLAIQVDPEPPAALELAVSNAATEVPPPSAGLVQTDLQFDEQGQSSESKEHQVSSSSSGTGLQLLPPAASEASGEQDRSQSNVNLSPPVGIELPPLFPSHPPEHATTTESKAAAANDSGNQVAGQSPALYDEALVQPPAQATGTIATNSTVESSPADTKLPSYSAMLAGTSSNANVSTAALRQEQASPVQPAGESGTATADGIQSTHTPESKAEAIIAAWQRYHSINQAESRTPNRYAPTGSSPAAVGGQSYMLGNPSQPALPTQSR